MYASDTVDVCAQMGAYMYVFCVSVCVWFLKMQEPKPWFMLIH